MKKQLTLTAIAIMALISSCKKDDVPELKHDYKKMETAQRTVDDPIKIIKLQVVVMYSSIQYVFDFSWTYGLVTGATGGGGAWWASNFTSTLGAGIGHNWAQTQVYTSSDPGHIYFLIKGSDSFNAPSHFGADPVKNDVIMEWVFNTTTHTMTNTSFHVVGSHMMN